MPVESRLAFDAVAIGVEGDALAGDGGVEIGEGLEMSVDDRLDRGPRKVSADWSAGVYEGG